VDCSKIYINMCEKAREIQSSKREHGDLIVLKGWEYLVGYDVWWLENYDNGETCEQWVSGYWWGSDNPTFYGARCIFLPRQDQLQEMLISKIGGNHISLLSSLVQSDLLNQAGLGHYVTSSLYHHTESMEQLWLAFVMLELYNKKWDGTKWTK